MPPIPKAPKTLPQQVLPASVPAQPARSQVPDAAPPDAPPPDAPPPVRLDPASIARSSYLGYRIQALRAEIEALKAERVDLLARIREVPDAKSPEARELKRRKSYLDARPKEAQAELQAAFEERRALTRPAG